MSDKLVSIKTVCEMAAKIKLLEIKLAEKTKQVSRLKKLVIAKTNHRNEPSFGGFGDY